MGASRNWLIAGAAALGLCMATSLPGQVIYSENFESGTSLEDQGFTVYDIGGTAETPVPPVWLLRGPGDTGPAPQRGATSRVAQIYFDANNPLDDYLITPGLNLEAGKNYQFFYTVSGGGNSVVDEMDVYLFEGPIPDEENAIEIQIFGELITSYDFFEATELRAATTPRHEEFTLSPTTTGTYHVAFYARSLADQFFIWVDDILIYDPSGPPMPTETMFPADSATNINAQTWIYFEQNPTATSHTVFFSTNQADVAAGTAPKILDAQEDIYFADPGTLAPNTTYYYRIDAANANGPTEGSVVSFTTRPAATAAGHIFWADSFDQRHLHPRAGDPVNSGYPALPKGWDSVDLDGLTNREGFVSAFYVESDGTATRQLSQPSALRSRGSADGQSNDWVFLPPVETHATLDTVLRLWARGGAVGIVESATVSYSTNAGSTNPADYTNPLGVISTDPVSYEIFLPYDYLLPQGQTVRVAINCTSDLGSRFIIDDVQVFINEPPPGLAVLSPPDGAVDVNLESWIVSPTALGLTGLELYFGTNEADVANRTVAPIDPVTEGAWYFDPGTLAPSTTYYAMLRTENESGFSNGAVSSFTTRAAVTAEGGTFFFENLDSHPYSIPNTVVNAGYPTLPKAWDAFDADGLTTRAGQVVPFYVFASPTASQRFTPPNGLWSRGSADGQTDDWVFFPPVETHPTFDTVLRFYARGGDSSIDEIADIRYSTNTSSSDPADYTNLIDTLFIPGPDFLTFQLREYVLPKGQNIRVAINCYSTMGSRFILDDFSISVLAGPDPQMIVHPANGATNVNNVTYLYLPNDLETDRYTVYFSANQAEVQNKTVTPILLDSTDVFYADPGNLAPNTTYYVLVVASNDVTSTDGPVTSFTTRAAPTAGGHTYWFENFDAPHLHPRSSGIHVNAGYPDLPKGWETVDVDGHTTRAGLQTGFYVENLGTASFNRSQPAALWSRGTAAQTSNDWVFMPPVDTHPTLDTVVRIWARGGTNNLPEIADVRYSTNAASINPADYSQLLGVIDISEPGLFLTYLPYDFILPKGETVRVAVNCYSFDGSRFILDDISVFISTPPPALSPLWPLNGDNEVAGSATYFYFPSNPDVNSYTVYLSPVEAEVVNKSIAPVISNVTDQLYGDPGDMLPGTTYYARLVTSNDSGPTDGPVISFTTLPTPTDVGDRYFIERFTPLHSYPNPATRAGYPPLPKNWVSVDVDGLPTLISGGWPAGFYVEQGSSTQNRSAPHSLWSRGINGGQSNDWVFLPPVNTHPELNTVVRIWARGGFSGVSEIGDVLTSSMIGSIDPADYTNLLGTIETSPAPTSEGPPNFATYEAYDFVLPKGEATRVAINGRTFDGSRFILDDIEIFLDEASTAIPGDYSGDGMVNVEDVTALANFLNGIGSISGDPDFNADGDFDEDDIVDLADFIVNQ